LHGIPFPGLPTILTHLRLMEIPHSGYIIPEAMAEHQITLSHLLQLE